MLQNAGAQQKVFTPYEQLSHRIHRQVNSSAAQMYRRTIITRRADERVDDWDCLIEQLAGEDSVHVTRLGCGSIKLSWRNQHRQ